MTTWHLVISSTIKPCSITVETPDIGEDRHLTLYCYPNSVTYCLDCKKPIPTSFVVPAGTREMLFTNHDRLICLCGKIYKDGSLPILWSLSDFLESIKDRPAAKAYALIVDLKEEPQTTTSDREIANRILDTILNNADGSKGTIIHAIEEIKQLRANYLSSSRTEHVQRFSLQIAFCDRVIKLIQES